LTAHLAPDYITIRLQIKFQAGETNGKSSRQNQ
jgi:hypothetical protein